MKSQLDNKIRILQDRATNGIVLVGKIQRILFILGLLTSEPAEWDWQAFIQDSLN